MHMFHFIHRTNLQIHDDDQLGAESFLSYCKNCTTIWKYLCIYLNSTNWGSGWLGNIFCRDILLECSWKLQCINLGFSQVICLWYPSKKFMFLITQKWYRYEKWLQQRDWWIKLDRINSSPERRKPKTWLFLLVATLCKSKYRKI